MMKKIVTAALLTMPLSLFAEATAPAAAPTATEAPAAAVTKVTCVGKIGSALTDEQKKALATAGVKEKTFKNWKSAEVDSAEKCKGAYTIANGTASKVAHKMASKHATKK